VTRYAQTARAFAALTPIIAGRELALEAHLTDLAPADEGPMRNAPGTHFARLAVIHELVYQGAPQRPDHLTSPYLLFTAVHDGPVDEWLDGLARGLGAEVEAIWGQCAGFSRAGSLREYLRHNELTDTGFAFASYPGSVEEVRADLALRERLRAFVRAHQHDDEAALQQAWGAEFGPGSGP
jgi:hypothetical protein